MSKRVWAVPALVLFTLLPCLAAQEPQDVPRVVSVLGTASRAKSVST